jgi:hypothetical protein
MTVDFFIKSVCNNQENKILVSDKKIYDASSKKNIPKYALVEKNAREVYEYYHYNEKSNEYVTRTFLWTESLYLDYLFFNKKKELKKLLDSGTLYRTVMEKGVKVNRAVEEQVGKWEQIDKDIALAVKNGDTDKCDRLRNNLRARAEEMLFPKILYV